MVSLGRLRRLLAFVLLTAGRALGGDEPLRIDSYVDLVVRSNPGSDVGKALEERGAAERRGARLIADPTLELTFGRGRPTDGTSDRAPETGISISQNLPWPLTRAATIQAADFSAEAGNAQAAAVRRGLVVQARTAFYALLRTRALVAVERSAESDARSLSELVARRAELGESREVDRIKARVEWLKQQRELSAVEREAAAAEAVIRALAVVPLPRPLLVDGELPGTSTGIGRTGDVLFRAIDGNPDLLRSKAEAVRASALLSAARRSRVPDLGLSLFHQKEIDRDAYGFSLGVTVPLWNARRGDVAKAAAEASLADAEARRARVALLAELEERLKDVDVASSQASTLMTELVPAATESLRLARLLYEEGETSLLDLLDAQRTARETRREEIRARYDLGRALNELYRLLGPETPEGRSSR